jgi:hypothetical protein
MLTRKNISLLQIAGKFPMERLPMKLAQPLLLLPTHIHPTSMMATNHFLCVQGMMVSIRKEIKQF